MAILENKKDIATKFFNEWTETAIHWYGLEFDYSTLEEWIHVEYIPNDISSISIDKTFGYDSGWIGIDIMARKENRTYEICDMLVDMLSSARVGNNFVKSVDIQGKDLISTDNGDYRVLTISILLKTI